MSHVLQIKYKSHDVDHHQPVNQNMEASQLSTHLSIMFPVGSESSASSTSLIASK